MSATSQQVSECVPMARRIALGFCRRLPLGRRDGVLSDGLFGLVQAGRRFNPSTQVDFAWYAAPRVRGAILDGFRRDDPLSRRARKAGISVEHVGLAGLAGRPDADVCVAVDLRRALEQLPSRESFVLSLLYCDDLNLVETGAVIGVTAGRVCQLRARTLGRLREWMTAASAEAAGGA